jgi:hypothetical protein
VTLDGKPLAQAGIMFLPRGNTLGGVCLGMTDARGQYTLRPERGTGAGAPVGEFAVTVSKMRQLAATKSVGQPSAAETGSDETLSAKYWDSSLTVLSARIPEGGTTVDFALRSRP